MGKSTSACVCEYALVRKSASASVCERVPACVAVTALYLQVLQVAAKVNEHDLSCRFLHQPV